MKDVLKKYAKVVFCLLLFHSITLLMTTACDNQRERYVEIQLDAIYIHCDIEGYCYVGHIEVQITSYFEEYIDMYVSNRRSQKGHTLFVTDESKDTLFINMPGSPYTCGFTPQPTNQLFFVDIYRFSKREMEKSGIWLGTDSIPLIPRLKQKRLEKLLEQPIQHCMRGKFKNIIPVKITKNKNFKVYYQKGKYKYDNWHPY